MNKYILVLLSVIAGVLSGLAWTGLYSGLILLLAFAPFVVIEEHIFRNPDRYSQNDFLKYILPGLFIFNLIALEWTRAAGIIAALTIISGLTLLMSFVLWVAHLIRLRAGNRMAFAGIVTLWLAFEYLSLHTIYLSPWMNLGNGLSRDITFIQWYEVTGVGGGTLWILLSNILLGSAFNLFMKKPSVMNRFLVIWLFVLIVPFVISLTRYLTIKSSAKYPEEVVLIQPNIDPFTQKYSVSFEEQLKKVITMAEKSVSDSTSWVLAPETVIDDPINEATVNNDKYIIQLRKFTHQHPKISILAGIVTFNAPEGNTDISVSGKSPSVTEHYNSAVRIDTGLQTDIYHKSRLVAGIEREFSASFGKLVNKVIPDYYGTGWGYGIQKDREIFSHGISGHKVAPVICYESVFGDFVADYVREGAEAIFIITNDGWWKNTGGYRQHLSYASLRAIETRRPIARAANTGISCLIDIRGKRINETKWWEESVLSGRIYYENRITPYQRYGDFIFKISSVIAIFIVLYVFLALPVRKRR